MNDHGENKNKTTFSDAEKIRQQLNDLPIDDYIEKHTAKPKTTVNQATKGYAAVMHVVSGILVGALMGYGIDHFANTLPVFTAILIPLGMIAGFKNMIRALKENEKDEDS